MPILELLGNGSILGLAGKIVRRSGLLNESVLEGDGGKA